MNSKRFLGTLALALLSTCAMVSLAETSALPSAMMMQQNEHRSGQRAFTARNVKREGSGRSPVSARPMATPSSVALPAATTKVGFLTASRISTGANTNPYLVVSGDFNNDGLQDIATIMQDPDGSYWLTVLLGNGDGTFRSPISTAVVFGAHDLVAARDLNDDGYCDVVLVHSGSVDVLLGVGTGHFEAAVNHADSISAPAAVAVVDVTGDTEPDIVVANATADGTGNSPVQTMKNTGSGAFAAFATVHYPGAMSSGILVDIGNGYLDLISTSQFFRGTSGDFATPVALSDGDSCGSLTGSVAVGNVNGSGAMDVVTADCSNGTITVFLGNLNGTLGAGASFAAGHRAGAVTLADVDGDGQIDAVVSDFYSMGITVLVGNGDGTFRPPTVGYPAGGGIQTAPLVANFSGLPDIVIPSVISEQWS
ncbi:MAG: VCBS repeat-containing protein, partial [Terriglobales bacterium]